MINLDEIELTTLMARGAYATVRSVHEDEKKNLQMLCGDLSSTASKVLRRMQPDNDNVPESVADLIANARTTLDAMEMSTKRIESLAQQRATLKPKAWGK